MTPRLATCCVVLALGCDLVDQSAAPSPSGQDPTPATTPAGDTEPGADSESDSDSDPDPGLVLRPPPLDTPEPPAPSRRAKGRQTLAYQFNAPIYRRPDGREIRGFARRGRRMPVARWVSGSGCRRGWLELSTGGYVCNQLGFDTSRTPADLPEWLQTRAPQDRPLPFTYARVRETGRPVWTRVPDPDEAPDEASQGVTFVAVDREIERDDGETFVRDVRGRVLHADDLVPAPVQTLRGESLGDGAATLPLAFVHEPQVAVLDPADPIDGQPRGVALRFARFAVTGELAVGGDAFVTTPHGLVARAGVRVARAVDRPDGVAPDEQWIHVDLAEQTLVAYEGDRPVRATLVSSGKPGYEPPLGLFRVHKKYAIKRMQGDDPVDGSYDIDQVPWTMYYWGSYALHGAYWHDGFGHVRSHGCTNVPPVDARWLFRWAEPSLRPGWHAEVGVRGPWVYTTAGNPAADDPSASQ